MSRILCQQCYRPKVTCICAFVSKVANTMPVIVLQHPNEVGQSKGSLTLLANSLNHCTVIVGEDFSENTQLNLLLANYREHAYLLYPHEQAITLQKPKAINHITKQQSLTINNQTQHDNACLILIDATWKKAYRMFMLSNNLQQLIKLQLPQGYQSHYLIRKTSVTNGLSTLEACCYALGLIEQDESKYLSLIDKFKEFNHFLLSFRQKINSNNG